MTPPPPDWRAHNPSSPIQWQPNNEDWIPYNRWQPNHTAFSSSQWSSDNVDWVPHNPPNNPSSQWPPSNDSSILPSREHDLPELETSVSSGPSKKRAKSTNTKAKVTKIRLTQEQDTKLLRLCIANARTFGQPKNMISWWDNVGDKFNKWLQKEFTNHRRHVGTLVQKRQFNLSMLGTGEEDETGPYIEAIDEWISIYTAYQDDIGERKKTADEEKLEHDLMQDKRNDWTMLLSQRNKRKAENSDNESEDDDFDEDHDESGRLSTSHSQSSTAPVPRRVQQLRQQSSSRSSSQPSSARVTPETGSTLTAAKQAKLEVASTGKAIMELANAVTTMIDQKSKASSVDESLSIRLKKLEDDANEARKDR